jgi:hypothetical protein
MVDGLSMRTTAVDGGGSERGRAFTTSLVAALVTGLLGAQTDAWAINTGDIIVADCATGLVFVDRVTGAQHVLSGTPSGGCYVDVTSNSSGDVLALASEFPGSIYKINTITGARSLVATGGHLDLARTMDLGTDGFLYVSKENSSEGLIRVDPASGVQTVVAGGLMRAFVPAGVGFGYVALGDTPTPPSYHLYRVDLGTGQLTRISSTGFSNPLGLALDMSGDVIVTDSGDGFGYQYAWRVDPTSGSVTVLPALFLAPWGVSVESDGAIIVGDNQNVQSCTRPEDYACPGALYRVDTAAGQTLMTEKGLFHDVAGVDVYRGPNVATPTLRRSWGQLKSRYR